MVKTNHNGRVTLIRATLSISRRVSLIALPLPCNELLFIRPIDWALLEEFLRDRSVDDLYAVDSLGHPEVHAEARDRIGLRDGEASLLLQEFDRFAYRNLHGHVEVDIQSQRIVVGSILRAWSTHGFPRALVQDELQCGGQGLFERPAIDLAVALHAVRIAGVEQGALIEDRDVERRSDGESFQIQVASPFSRRPRTHDDEVGRRSDAHDAEERRQRQLDAARQQRDLALRVSLDDSRRWCCD